MDIINESIFTSSSKMKPHEKLLVGSVIDFMKHRYKFDSKIIVKKQTKPNFFGDVSLSDNSVNNDKFYLHILTNVGTKRMIQYMIHELTHVKQISKGELLPDKDWKSILWKKQSWLSVKEYKKIMKKGDWKTYLSLPWEKEAITNEKKLIEPYLNSPQFKELRGKSDDLDYIIDNI